MSVRRRAHPRAGGENPTKATQPTTCNGSSPRGRGKQTPPQKSTHKARLIPARAGKTPGRSSLACSPSAHPRAGGENPRGRGFGRRLSRLIPARAGKTPSPPSPSTATQAHPRAGGENPKTRSTPLLGPGSSPRGRGKPLGGRYLTCLPRLIPARAGKTVTNTERHPHGTAHPRAGGENLP